MGSWYHCSMGGHPCTLVYVCYIEFITRDFYILCFRIWLPVFMLSVLQRWYHLRDTGCKNKKNENIEWRTDKISHVIREITEILLLVSSDRLEVMKLWPLSECWVYLNRVTMSIGWYWQFCFIILLWYGNDCPVLRRKMSICATKIIKTILSQGFDLASSCFWASGITLYNWKLRRLRPKGIWQRIVSDVHFNDIDSWHGPHLSIQLRSTANEQYDIFLFDETHNCISFYRHLCVTCYHIEVCAWWRHQMETVSALPALCAGNSPVTGVFPTQRPVTRGFDVLFDLRLNKRLSKQSWGWWFESPSRSLWRHSNDGLVWTLHWAFSNTSLHDCALNR